MTDEQHSHQPPADSTAPPGPTADAAPGPPGVEPEGPAGDLRRPSRRAAWLAMGAVALALGLVYIAPGISDDHADDTPEDTAMVGRKAPLHYTLKDMHGVDVKLSSFVGKVIVLNFWATWCPPCEQEIPWLVEVQNAHKDDLVIVGVSIDDTADLLKPYAAKMQMNYPVLVGAEHQDMQDAYGPMYGIPVSVFIDREGKIARRHSGIFTKEQFEREIKGLL